MNFLRKKDTSNVAGERLETSIFNSTAVEHLHRYALAMDFVEGKTVLDIACGEGYGSFLLSKKAKRVIGVDIAGRVIEKASRKYKEKNLKFIQGSVSDIPLDSGNFDVVVSFETIEHTHEHDAMLDEIRRVLKENGLLIISTPNKRLYSEKDQYVNPFHVKELYEQEFIELISKRFGNIIQLYQSLMLGSLIVPGSIDRGFNNYQIYQGNYTEIHSSSIPAGKYLLIFASNGPLPSQAKMVSLFEGAEFIEHGIATGVRKSMAYQIGNLIVAPLMFVKNLFR